MATAADAGPNTVVFERLFRIVKRRIGKRVWYREGDGTRKGALAWIVVDRPRYFELRLHDGRIEVWLNMRDRECSLEMCDPDFEQKVCAALTKLDVTINPKWF